MILITLILLTCMPLGGIPMANYDTPVQHEESDRLLTAFIDTYNASFPSGQPFP